MEMLIAILTACVLGLLFCFQKYGIKTTLIYPFYWLAAKLGLIHIQ